MHDITNDSDVTLQSCHENPIIGIPIVECPVNYRKNAIIIAEVEFNYRPLKVLKLYNSKQRGFVQFSEANYAQEIIAFIKEYILAKIKYCIFFKIELCENLSIVLQKYCKNSEINFVKCTQYLTDVTVEDEIIQIITNFYEGKTTHRGIYDTKSNKIIIAQI